MIDRSGLVVDAYVEQLVEHGVGNDGNITFLTGAGISAESGIPTYRGSGGTWTTGGIEEMNRATYAWFVRNPEKVWERDLNRRAEFAVARPNAAHAAIARLRTLERFVLVTQNIDGLHGLAGHGGQRYVELHGNISRMRCRDGCVGVFPIPADAVPSADGPPCPSCGRRTRPHVLWFDEFYDEENYRMKTARLMVGSSALLVTVGTSGKIPVAVDFARIAIRRGAVHIDINPEDNELRGLAVESGGGFIASAATEAVPALADALLAAIGSDSRSATGQLT